MLQTHCQKKHYRCLLVKLITLNGRTALRAPPLQFYYNACSFFQHSSDLFKLYYEEHVGFFWISSSGIEVVLMFFFTLAIGQGVTPC